MWPDDEDYIAELDGVSAQVDRSPEGGDHEDGRHAEHESAVNEVDAPKGSSK